MSGDLSVHQRLRERRLITLVVAMAAVAEDVDDDVASELLAVLDRQLGNVDDRLGIVTVHVEDRRHHHLGHVARIGR